MTTQKRALAIRGLGLFLLCLMAKAPAAGSLTLVAEDDWYPYSADKNGQVAGMAVDIVREAYQAAGVTIKIKSMPYARCMKLVELGREIGCFNALKDASTESVYRFGKYPLFSARLGIYTHTPQAFPVTLGELAGKRVGVTNGYTYGSEVELNREMKKEVAATDLSNLRKLAVGRLDYALVFTQAADHLVNDHSETLRGRIYKVGSVTDNPLYVGFSRRHAQAAEAMQQLDRGMALIKQNGRYQQIVNNWQPSL